MKINNKNLNTNLRYNLLNVFIYIIGTILIIQLFKLQIIKGEDYRDTSNSRLSRESTIKAARGNIYDRNNEILATTRIGYGIEFYRTKISNDELNNTILKIINLLEENGEEYINNFPIDENFEFTYTSNESILKWKKKYEINENADTEECINKFKEKYEISNTNINEIMKIIAIRYEITINGYSATKSIKIAEDISEETAIKFNERNSEFPGINIVEEPIREYPKGSLAAHIIGYVGKISSEELKNNAELGYTLTDYIGKMGIEYVLENRLRGISGVRQIDMSVEGTVEDEYIEKEAIAGNSVTLSIDSRIQAVAEKAIKDEIIELQANGRNSTYGAAVLMNVKNGEVLAMCSYPTYNPELFIGGISTEDWNDIRDNNKLYDIASRTSSPPGSTFKMVVAAAALEEGVTTEEETVNDKGVYPYGHNPVCWIYSQNHAGHGKLNIREAIQKSCNYYFYEMGKRLGVDIIAKYAKYFGLGSKTGIEITNESKGTVASSEESEKNGEQWYLSDTLSAAIGQSKNGFTTIQMARYISKIANGGNDVSPTLIKEVKDVEGNTISKEDIRKYTNDLLGITEEENLEVKVSQETLNIIKEGMRLVTSRGGTAYSVFKDFEKSVAGKTGSAQATSTRENTTISVTNGWFVGFTPYENSEVAVVVLLEDGALNSAATKVAKKILEEYYKLNSDEVNSLNEDMTAPIYAGT